MKNFKNDHEIQTIFIKGLLFKYQWKITQKIISSYNYVILFENMIKLVIKSQNLAFSNFDYMHVRLITQYTVPPNYVYLVGDYCYIFAVRLFCQVL